MITFDSNNLEDGVDYFCVHKGVVHYLTSRFLYDHVEDLASFVMKILTATAQKCSMLMNVV